MVVEQAIENYTPEERVSFVEALSLARQRDFRMIEVVVADKIRSRLQGGSERMSSKMNYGNRARSAECKLEVSLDSNSVALTIDVNVLVGYGPGVQKFTFKKRRVSNSKYPIAATKIGHAVNDIVASVKTQALAMMEEMLFEIPICVIPTNKIPKDFTELATKKGICYGRIRGMSRGLEAFANPDYCVCMDTQTAQIVALPKNKQECLRMITVPVNRFNYNAASYVTKNSYEKFPPDPISFIHLCQWMGELYDKFKDPRVPQMPELTFLWENGVITTCTWVHGALNVSETFSSRKLYETTIRQRIQAIFKQVANVEAEYAGVREEEQGVKKGATKPSRVLPKKSPQEEVLASLNPTELAILRCIVNKEELRLLAMTSMICTEISSKNIYKYVDRLCKTEVLVDGVPVPIVEFRWSKRHGAGGVPVFFSSIPWNPQMLNRAVPAPYKEEDLENMTKSARERWSRRMEICK